MTTGMAFLDAVSGYARSSTGNSADIPIRLAIIDPDYDPFGASYPDSMPAARVTFEGETTLSGKAYAVARGFVPQGGNRVYMLPVGSTWFIAGSVRQDSAQGFYSDGGFSGIEFGDGNYFDTEGGLFLQTDAEIQGDLTVGGWDYGRGLITSKELTATSTASNVETVHWSTNSINWLANRCIRVDVMFHLQNNTANAWSFVRIRKATATGTLLKEFGRVPNIIASSPGFGPSGSIYFVTGAGGAASLAMTLQASGTSTASFFGSVTKGLGSRIDVFDIGPSSQYTALGTYPVLF